MKFEFLESKIVTGKFVYIFKSGVIASSSFYWLDSLAGSIAGRKPKNYLNDFLNDLLNKKIKMEQSKMLKR